MNYHKLKENFERNIILAALKLCEFNRRETAAVLGVSYAGFDKMFKRLKIDPTDTKQHAPQVSPIVHSLVSRLSEIEKQLEDALDALKRIEQMHDQAD